MAEETSGLLAGVRVLDLSIWRPGPYATQLLADIGAEVIKVEPPGGDPMRGYPELFASLHANQRSLVLDLKAERGRARALDLAAGADVVVEGFRPGVAERLGVGYEHVLARNPSVVYCSVSGYGQTGRRRTVPGHDVNYTAWSGALAPDGGRPAIPALPIADLAGGMAAAFAISAALVHRLRTGEGEHIDVSMTDVLATWTGVARPTTATDDAATADADDAESADEDEAGDGRPRGVAGYGTFVTADGRWVALGVISEPHFWRSLCVVLGLEDVAELAFGARHRRAHELQRRIAAAIARRNRDAVVDELLEAGVPVAPVLDRDEVAASPDLRERGVITQDPWSGDDEVVAGHPVRFDHHPAARATPPPTLDEHPDADWRRR